MIRHILELVLFKADIPQLAGHAQNSKQVFHRSDDPIENLGCVLTGVQTQCRCDVAQPRRSDRPVERRTWGNTMALTMPLST